MDAAVFDVQDQPSLKAPEVLKVALWLGVLSSTPQTGNTK